MSYQKKPNKPPLEQLPNMPLHHLKTVCENALEDAKAAYHTRKLPIQKKSAMNSYIIWKSIRYEIDPGDPYTEKSQRIENQIPLK